MFNYKDLHEREVAGSLRLKQEIDKLTKDALEQTKMLERTEVKIVEVMTQKNELQNSNS